MAFTTQSVPFSWRKTHSYARLRLRPKMSGRSTSPGMLAGRDLRGFNREINAGLMNLTIKTRLAEVATTPKIFTPAEFGDHVAAEIEKWGVASENPIHDSRSGANQNM